MRKVKNALLILLAVAFLAAGGLLPMAAAQLQDKATTDAVQYGDIEALQLKLEEEVLSMPITEKMHLMVNGIGKGVTEDMGRMKEGEAIEAAYAALQPYADIYGVSLDNDALDCSLVACYDENDPTTICYYWHMNLSLDQYQNDAFMVILDDETGILIAAEWNNEAMDTDPAYLQKLQLAISAVYFEHLGLEPVTAIPVETENAQSYDKGIAHLITLYELEDMRHGQVFVEIGVTSNGFYIVPA